MSLTCMLPPPLVSLTAVFGGTSRVAFSPQIPAGMRQPTMMVVPLAVVLSPMAGRTRAIGTPIASATQRPGVMRRAPAARRGPVMREGVSPALAGHA